MEKKKHRRDWLSPILRVGVWTAMVLTVATLVLIIAYILIMGVPHLKLSLFSPTYTSDNASMLPSILNTLWVILVSLGISVPLGIGLSLIHILTHQA